MSGLLFNYKGFHAQGTEINGHGVSEEQTTLGTIVTANGTSAKPATVAASAATAVAAGKNAHGLSK
jgi:hypothetical protein